MNGVMEKTYEAYASNKERISPEKFMGFSDREKAGIRSIRIIAPSFYNENDFGWIEIERGTQMYKFEGF